MRKTNLIMGICFGFFLFSALSLGNRMYLLIAILIFLLSRQKRYTNFAVERFILIISNNCNA